MRPCASYSFRARMGAVAGGAAQAPVHASCCRDSFRLVICVYSINHPLSSVQNKTTLLCNFRAVPRPRRGMESTSPPRLCTKEARIIGLCATTAGATPAGATACGSCVGGLVSSSARGRQCRRGPALELAAARRQLGWLGPLPPSSSVTQLPPDGPCKAPLDTGAVGGCWELAGAGRAPTLAICLWKGRGLVQASQGAGHRARLPAALPAGTQLPTLLGAVVSNLVPKMLLSGWRGSGRCACGASWPRRRHPLGTEVRGGKGPQLLQITVRGAIFAARLGQRGCGEAATWKIPLPRANEWLFSGRAFVDFKNLNQG